MYYKILYSDFKVNYYTILGKGKGKGKILYF